jgi:hypothetical protein
VRPNDLLFALQTVPFYPFRVVMNDGAVYDVRHPEVVRAGRSAWWYYFLPTPVGLVERYDILSYLLIARMEIAIPKPAADNGG